MTQEWDSIGVFKAVASGQVRVEEVLSVDIDQDMLDNLPDGNGDTNNER
jgi:hypothetical protein